MASPLHHQLLSQARHLAKLDPRRPTQANLRLAVSTAYYALFHYLTDQTCRCVLGTTNERRPYRDVLARGFEHGAMKRACTAFAGGTLSKGIQNRLPQAFCIPAGLQSVADAFKQAQQKRHLADYDRAETFARGEVLGLIRDVEEAMTAFSHVKSTNEARFFLACLLTWDALTNRA